MELDIDGRKVFGATGGKPFDPVLPGLIFLHGAGMDHTAWQLQSRYFAHHGQAVLALDLPGHGRSAGPPPVSIEGYRDWLLRVMTAAGWRRATLVGHSMGALIALATAAEAPERVSALALLGIADRMPVHPDLLAAADRGEPLANDLITAWAYGKPAHLGGHPAPGLWMLGGGKRLLEQCPPDTLANDLRACDRYTGAREAAARVACPTLVLLGALDRMTPAKSGRELAALVRGARVVSLPGCGHMMVIEGPDATLDALRELLAQRKTAAAP